nr:MAG TPA: hypothetical protein [Caudoviricetes sp.]
MTYSFLFVENKKSNKFNEPIHSLLIQQVFLKQLKDLHHL